MVMTVSSRLPIPPDQEFPMPRRPLIPPTSIPSTSLLSAGSGPTVGRRAALAGAAATLPLLGRRARAADPITIGWVGPLSPPGGYAEGALMKQAAQLAADEINAKGGVLGRQIQVVFADTRGKPEEGTAAAERLIS